MTVQEVLFEIVVSETGSVCCWLFEPRNLTFSRVVVRLVEPGKELVCYRPAAQDWSVDEQASCRLIDESDIWKLMGDDIGRLGSVDGVSYKQYSSDTAWHDVATKTAAPWLSESRHELGVWLCGDGLPQVHVLVSRKFKYDVKGLRGGT